MTVETYSDLRSHDEPAKAGPRPMTDLTRAPQQRLVFPDTEAGTREALPVRWPRVFPSL
jgi:hypothetical protein